MAGRPTDREIAFSRSRAARVAAARARALAKTSRQSPGLWERGELYWKRAATLFLNAVVISAVVFVGWLLWNAVSERVIVVASMSVPKSLEASGYTAEVAAQRLQSALNKIISNAHEGRRGREVVLPVGAFKLSSDPKIAMQGDLPKITLPVAGLPLDTVVDTIRPLIPNKRSNVTGDITLADNKLWLRLRMGGKDLFVTTQGVDPGRPDDLFSDAAEKVFEETNLFLLAASLSDRDSDRSLKMVDRLVRSLPPKDPIVAWARSLAGWIMIDQGKFSEGADKFEKSDQS